MRDAPALGRGGVRSVDLHVRSVGLGAGSDVQGLAGAHAGDDGVGAVGERAAVLLGQGVELGALSLLGERRVAEPVVHIHGAADAGDGTRARVLPHVRVARGLADAVVLRAPLAPAVEHGARQVVLPPARARVDAGLVPRRGNLAVERARDGRELRRVERHLLILEVEVHGQIGGVPLRLHLVHEVDRVVRLTRRVLGIHRVGVQVRAPRDPQALAFGDVALEVLVHAVVPPPDTDDGEIDARRLHRVPVDLILELADIDTLRRRTLGQRVHRARPEVAAPRALVVQAPDQLAVLKTPGITPKLVGGDVALAILRGSIGRLVGRDRILGRDIRCGIGRPCGFRARIRGLRRLDGGGTIPGSVRGRARLLPRRPLVSGDVLGVSGSPGSILRSRGTGCPVQLALRRQYLRIGGIRLQNGRQAHDGGHDHGNGVLESAHGHPPTISSRRAGHSARRWKRNSIPPSLAQRAALAKP